ncbi:membrane protein insertion efficiency factor YidD [Candidatus Roizmanbacteria bacterium RIFCSPHIGHO2_01_FULL_39_12b]|uniref:Membrane protein insertion efficiency factor YidD n=1 Tax=Candidatus Roizmanbacteria bacterium RIFCSPHIGHO2_01_FULL_39_12b TaxID=1802030 RepID=A0A1F7G8L5_9BACT|nr:MAG: membrane protein insertion efficiency factor YidD [Candidatus Roizmanbacteria bacterium RIFCSPHIGHO2_01_FULL_39_12b]OGK46046.1 MAG: membrane protein insertion efficiency factor YidD [Candidatus Roizmanbacteria bacterium RIFCSPLOWO2_01_FULL_39_19]
MIKKPLVSLIKWYQKNQPLRLLVGSHFLLFGGDCKFHPTCSKYFEQAVRKYGVIKGSSLGVWRIVRCNPFSKGGHDLV